MKLYFFDKVKFFNRSKFYCNGDYFTMKKLLEEEVGDYGFLE